MFFYLWDSFLDIFYVLYFNSMHSNKVKQKGVSISKYLLRTWPNGQK